MADQFDKYLAQEHQDEFEKYAESVAQTPSPQPYNPPEYFNNAFGFVQPKDENLAAAAQAGVDVSKPGPQGARTGYEGFAVNEGQWTDFITNELSNTFKQPVEVRRGPQSGKYEYFDPIDKRWTLLQHSSIGQAAISKSSDALMTLGSMAGLVGGPASTAVKEIGAGAVKTAAGTGLADMVRTQIGNWLGVNDTATMDDRFSSAGKTAAVEGAIDAGAATAFNIARYARASVKGKNVFTPEEAQELLNGMGKYRGLADEINRGSDVEYTPFIHQLVDPNNPAAQTASRWYQILTSTADPELRMAVAQARSNEYGALRSYFANANKPFDIGIPATAEGRQQAGQPLQQGIQNSIEQGTAQARQAADGAEAASRQAAQGLPQGVAPANIDAAQAARDQLWAQSVASSARVGEKYKDFNNLISYDAAKETSPYYVTIDDPETIEYINKFGRNTITGDMKGGKPHVGVGGKVKVDVATLDATAKRLDQLYRDKTEAGMDVGYSDRDLVAAHNKVLDTMSNYLKQGSMDGTLPPETYQSWIAARAAAKQDATTFKNGFLAKFLAKDKTGQWVINDQDAVKTMIQGRDIQALTQMKGMIEQDPVAMGEMKKLLWTLYEKKATKNGLMSQKGHDAFMKSDQFGPVMDLFFKNDEFTKLRSYKDVADSMFSTLEKAKSIEKTLRQEFGGKITRWSPEQIVRNVMSKSLDSAQTAKLMAMTSKFPGSREALRNGVKNEVQMKVFPQGMDGAMDDTALSNIVRDYAGNLTAVMGPEYVNSLRRLTETVPMLRRNPPAIGEPPVQTRLQMALRGIVRPMSREGNFMSFLKQNRGENLPYAIWEALTNTDELKRLANYTRLAIMGTRVAGTSAAVASTQVRDEDYVKQ